MANTNLEHSTNSPLSYNEIISLINGVSKKKFLSDRDLYIKPINDNLNNLIEKNVHDLITCIRKLGVYTKNDLYLYNSLLIENSPLTDINGISLLKVVEERHDDKLGILRGFILGFLSARNNSLLSERISPNLVDNTGKYYVIGLMIAIRMLIINDPFCKLDNKILKFLLSGLSSADKEISNQALDISLRTYNSHKVKLKKPIKSYFNKSLFHKFNTCHSMYLLYPFVKDENLTYYFFHNLYNIIIVSKSLKVTKNYSYLLIRMIRQLRRFSVDKYEKKYQEMVENLVDKFVAKGWWDIVQMDEFLKEFGFYDLQTNGKHLRKLLWSNKLRIELVYFSIIIVKAFGFNKIIIDFLYHLHLYYNIIFLPTLKLLVDEISDKFNQEFITHKTLITQIFRKAGNQINYITLPEFECSTYDDLIPQTTKIFELVNSLRTKEFENSVNEIRWFDSDSKRRYELIRTLVKLLEDINQLLLQVIKPCNWINPNQLSANTPKIGIQNKLLAFEKAIYELTHPPDIIIGETVRKNLELFPIIKKMFTDKWIETQLKSNSYHPLLRWLNRYNDITAEKKDFRSESTFANLKNLEHSLSFFTSVTDKGTKTIMNELKDNHSFFDGLVHLQLAKKLSGKYKPIAEEKIEGKPVDIYLQGKNSNCIIEVTSIDMYQRLKYTTSVVQINDKVEPVFIKKTEKTSQIPKIKDPVIIAIDVSRSPESDPNELISALKGYKTVTEVRLDNNKMVIVNSVKKEYDAFSIIPESKNVSAVIYFRTQVLREDTQFFGYIFPNKKALIKFPDTELTILGKTIFQNDDFMTEVED
ncbi:hypothetical protein [Candidatus Nitrosocosmicus sp. FF01]|uniref:hypothetical protein n=1 Tax=Candidatus Nitrosocosmicus sp. FF01 TaxID=3397670 RepID=UPI0039ECEB92